MAIMIASSAVRRKAYILAIANHHDSDAYLELGSLLIFPM